VDRSDRQSRERTFVIETRLHCSTVRDGSTKLSMEEASRIPKVSKPSSLMRAQFREIARDIIARDRQARKNGLSQNTIGEIERAMVQAFVLGQETPICVPESKTLAATIDWLNIPPRSRDTLVHMTFSFSSRFLTALGGPREEIPASQLEVFEESGRKRWAFVHQNVRSERSVADGSVSPLVRLGLIRPLPNNEVRYELTESGARLCREYWRRSDADDPTLPRQGMR